MGDFRKEATIVGVVVSAAFLIALWTVFYLQGYIAQRNKVSYRAYFDDVGLLLEGDNVTVAGVPVGRVQSIRLEGGKAVVRFFVEPEITVTKNTVAVIEASDLFGESFLRLKLRQGAPAEPGTAIRGELAPGLRDLILRGVDVIERTTLVLEDARALIARLDTVLGPGSSFSRTLENIEVLTANTRVLSQRFEGYGNLLEETLSSLDSAAVGFRSVVQDNADGVRRTIAQLEDLSVRLDSILIDLESGRGALGRLLKDETLYEELRDTALEARNLIRKIRDNPELFIRLKVF